MASIGTNSGTLRATEHLVMARRLRVTASKLKTEEARNKLLQLANLYEQLSVCYLDEDTVEVPMPIRLSS